MDADLRVAKDPHRSRLSGNLFEAHLSGLISLRLCDVQRQQPELNLQFRLATNMNDANPFDDLILHVRWYENEQQHTVTYFFQLKHAEKLEKPVSAHNLTAAISKKNKDFNLRKYFEFFKRLKRLSVSKHQLNGNEDLLQKWSQEEYRFILFTTREVLPKAKATRGKSQLDFPFENIFSTSQGEIFSFRKADQDVWNMLAGSPDEEDFRTEFLPRLFIFSGQAPVKVLENFMVPAFQKVIQVQPQYTPQLLLAYMFYLQEWWESEEGTCLSEKATEIQKILKNFINTRLQQLSVMNKYCNALKQRLANTQGNGYQATFIIIPGIPQDLRCSAIRKVLNESHPEHFIILTESIIKDFPHEILYSICDNNELCCEVVLSIDTFNDDLTTFVDNILSKGGRNVRILSSKWDPRVYSLIISRNNQNDSWSERWTLDCLDSDEQLKLMNQCVSFQGREVTLSELEKAWSGLRRDIGDAALGALASGQTISFGNPLPAIDEQYISRSVRHPVSLKFSLLEIQSPKDHFMFSGFPEELLRKLRHPESSWQECSKTGVVLKGNNILSSIKEVHKTKWTEVKREFKNLSGEKKVNIRQVAKNILLKESNQNYETINQHWVSYENNELIWKRSEGNEQCLKDYVKEKCKHCKQSPICSHTDSSDFVKWEDKTLVLTDVAGMGKSTYLKHMANVIKKENPTQWVITVSMGQGNVMGDIREKIEFHHVLRILRQCAGIVHNISAYHYLRYCFENSGNITVLVDGVDEICPAQKVSAISMLQLLQEALQKSGGRLWVASRTVLKQDLALTLSKAMFISLLPLSSHDQEQFLLERWSNSDKCSNVSLSKCDVEDFVSVLQETTSKSDGYSLTDVPLYLQMVAIAYTQEDINKLHQKNQMNFASWLHKGTLYKRFVEKTLQNCLLKVGISECDQHNLNITLQDTLNKHAKYAALECFHDHKLLEKHYKDITDTVNQLKSDVKREQTARYGIITHVVDGQPKFLHYTLAEYLAALWLKDNYSTLDHLACVLHKDEFGELSYFFDFILAQGCTLHSAVMTENVDNVCSVLCQNKQLIEEEDSGGRTALHLAVISGNSEAVRELLRAGANVSKQDRVLGWTPLHYIDARIKIAAKDALKYNLKSLLQIAELLLTSSANPKDAPYMFGDDNIFTTAISADFPKICKRFIQNAGLLFFQKLLKKAYLHQAAEYGSLKVLSMLLHLGFDVNATSSHFLKGTALHVAAERGHTEFCKVLLRHGARVEIQDKDGNRPLHNAAQNNHRSICEVLLTHEANINVRNKDGKTPLHLAAWEGNGFLCHDLLKHGADSSAKDNCGHTAGDKASRWQYIADICQSFKNTKVVEEIDLIVRNEVFIQYRNEYLSKKQIISFNIAWVIVTLLPIIFVSACICYMYMHMHIFNFIQKGGAVLISLFYSITKNNSPSKRDINHFLWSFVSRFEIR